MIGTIVFYLPRRGYGFITSSDGKQFFFHISDFVGTPKANREVIFKEDEPVSSKAKYPSAVKVTLIEQPDVQASDLLDILAGKGGAQ